MSIRPVKRLIKAKPTMEGAGVHLRRAFGFGETADFDPFLLLDDFRNERPEDYLAGFPWHPHRGIETITYVLAGTVEHGDSLGQPGRARRRRRAVDDGGQRHHPPGDAAGRRGRPDARLPAVGQPAVVAEDDDPALPGRAVGGHPRGDRRRRHPRPRDLRRASGARRGPVDGIAADPRYLDVSVPPRTRRDAAGRDTYSNAFAYVFAGSGTFRDASEPLAVPTEGVGWADTTLSREADNRSLVLFDSGDEVTVQAGEEGIRFLLVSGRPIEEPVAWYGPIVMNTQEELRQAFAEFQAGTFLKEPSGHDGR